MEGHTRFYHLPYPVMVVALGTLMSRFGTSMVLPYITVLLVNLKHLSIYWAGAVISASFLSQAFGASFTANLLTRFLPVRLMKISLILYAVTFALMGAIGLWINHPLFVGCSFMFIALVGGGCRSIIETMGQAIISQMVLPAQKNFAFSLRYTLINVGSALGPILAIMLGILNTYMSFFAAAIAIMLYFFLLNYTVNIDKISFHAHKTIQFAETFKLMCRDKKLLYFTVAMSLCYIGFSQMGTLFAYTVNYFHLPGHVFAVMFAINGITVVLLSIPIVRAIEKRNLSNVILYGLLGMACGLIGVALSTTHPIGYYLSSFIFTVGEVLTLSLTGLYIDQLASPDNRYTYFSISNYMLIGQVTGPLIATLLCHALGLSLGLILMAVMTALGAPLMLLAKKQRVLQASI